jgi:outer membrane receptor protein involved in Fe transport
MSEVKSQKAKVKGQKSELRIQESGVGRQKAESRRQKAESRKQKAESRRQKAESRKQKAESRRQKAEGGRQKAEGGRQDSGFGSQRSEVKSQSGRNWARGIFVGLGSILFVSAALRAATIRGTVYDPSGRAVPNVHVSLLRSLAALDERQTNAKGEYEFEGLAKGSYRLVANAPGFSASTADVEIGKDQTRSLDLHLALSAVQQQVVVSASLEGSLAPQLGSSVSTISNQEIDDQGAQNVTDVLRGTPGVALDDSGRRGGVTGAFIRGGDSDYNLVMVDGIQLNEFGGDFDFAPLPADGVDHIEVMRGAESALFGSYAVTGVVNIVTTRGEGAPHFDFQEEGGNFTTRRFVTGGSGLTHGLSWAYDLSRLDSGGTVQNDRYRNQSAILSLGYRWSERRQVDFHFFGDANDAGAPGPYGSDPDDLYNAPIYPGGPTNYQLGLLTRDKENLFGYAGSYSEQITSRFRQVVTGTVATNDYYFSSPPASGGDSFSNNLRGVLNTRSEVAISNQDFLVAGFEYNREQIKNTFVADANGVPFLLPRASLAYFAENRWSPSSRLFVTAGLRLDDLRTHSLPAGDYGARPFIPASSITKLNPRASVAYMARETDSDSWLGLTRLHGSFATGIRAPDGFELAFTDNPHLKPEKSISFDSGVEQRFLNSRALLDLTYFYNKFDDQIVTLGGSLTNLSTFISDNLGNSRAQGLELSLRLHPTRALQVSGEYTLLGTAILSLDGSSLVQAPFHVGQELIRRPKNSGDFNLTWHRGRLTLNSNAYLRGQTLDLEPNDGVYACSLGLPCLFPDRGYVVLNGGFSYRLSRGLEIYGHLNNLLDRKYEEVLGYPALPLNFLAGVKFTFPAE